MSNTFNAETVEPPVDTGVTTARHSLVMMGHVHGIPVDEPTLIHNYGAGAWDTQTWQLAARSLGLKTKLIRQNPDRLAKAPLPAVAIDREGRYFILGKFEEGNTTSDDVAARQARVVIHIPGEQPKLIDLQSFLEKWDGTLILVASKMSLLREVESFDFSWFIPAIVKYRKLLGEVLIVSLILQLIGLATPMFFQVIMDKVLVNHAINTLNVIAVGLICTTLFETVLHALRSYVFAARAQNLEIQLAAATASLEAQKSVVASFAQRVGGVSTG